MSVMKWGLGVLGLAAVGVIAVAAIGFGGSASAQTPTPDPTAQTQDAEAQHALEVFASKLGVSMDDVRNAAKATRDQLVDEAVAKGQITADQAAKIKSMDVGSFLRFRTQHPLAVRARKAIGNVVQDAANFLHLSVDDIRSRIQGGASLADIAKSQNVDPAALQAQLVTQVTQEADQALADGTISQQTHDRILQNLDARIDKLVNHSGGFNGKLRGRGGAR